MKEIFIRIFWLKSEPVLKKGMGFLFVLEEMRDVFGNRGGRNL
jgi:hypothetical protein